MIVNEFIKNSPDEFYTVMEKYFNLIINTGHVPSEWCIGLIQTIFKNKGSVHDVDNYRGITLLSCMGKVFTVLIINRLNQYLEDNDTIGQEQAGLKQEFSTLDHIFTLHVLKVLNVIQNRYTCAKSCVKVGT